MTFEEAKKILEKEFAVINLHKSTEPFEFDDSNWFGYEKPSVLEAFRVLSKEGYYITISGHDYNMRENRLKEENEENTTSPNPTKNLIKGNFPGNKSIEYCGDSMPDSGEEQPEEKKGIIYPTTSPKADFYYKHVLKEGNPALKEAASQFNDALLDEQGKKIKRLGKEISKLNSIIHDKNAVLSDVAEKLRLTKIREKNLAELGLKYVGENEKLKKDLADKVVDKIDAQALKSAESALAYKEKVIADLGEELAATKKELEEKTKLIEVVRKDSKEYCYYGIAAEKMIQKMAKVIVEERAIDSEDLEKYRRWANGYRFNPQLYDFIEKEEKKQNAAKMVDINAKCMRAARESINDVFESYAAKYVKSTLDELKDKAYETFNAKAHKLGLVGSKDGKGIPDQMISVDIAEEGGDHSGVIVLCGTDFVKMLKENEDFIHDLFGKKPKEIKEFMSAEAERLFEGDGISTKMEVMKPSRKFKKIK